MTSQAEPDFSTDEQRWFAVLKRDPRAHDAFWYAVKTTGIYCRPTCPARRPRPGNVLFFYSPADAERSGFRPCRRCHPDQAGAPAADERIVRACRLLERAEGPPSLNELAASVDLSPYYFQRQFKRAVGVTPKQYGDAIRRQRLQSSLQEGTPVTRAVYEAGFGSSSRVHEKSRSLLGMTPSQYRQQGRNQRIQYALGRSSLGWVLVAASEQGICALEMGDSHKALLENLRQGRK